MLKFNIELCEIHNQQRSNSMTKRFVSILLALILASSAMISCSESKENADETTQALPTPPLRLPTTLARAPQKPRS